MNKKKILVILSVLLVSMLAATVASAGRPIIHSVSAGGPDACEAFGLKPGCDASFSLQAKMYADGSVSGQYVDKFGNAFGGGRIHATIDCLYVEGNDAWVSGVITQDSFSENGFFLGKAVSARLKDNGTTANDPPDQISLSWFVEAFEQPPFKCTDHPDVDLYDVPKGQVTVK
jgi:hypothetical protein